MAVEDCKMPTKAVLDVKVTDINRLINHTFTKEELNEKLRRQGSSDNKMAIWKRIELDRELKKATAAGDEEAIAQCEAQIAELTGPKLAFGTTLYKPRSDKPGEQERLAEINLRNQKLNTENVRRAQLEERKANRKVAAAVARGEAAADPFARVKTRAKIHYDHSSNNRAVPKATEFVDGNDRTHTEMPPTATRSTTPSSAPKKPSRGGTAVIRHRSMDDENIAALDLEIDIEI
jgi:RNA polymerase-associated protein RTF1